MSAYIDSADQSDSPTLESNYKENSNATTTFAYSAGPVEIPTTNLESAYHTNDQLKTFKQVSSPQLVVAPQSPLPNPANDSAYLYNNVKEQQNASTSSTNKSTPPPLSRKKTVNSTDGTNYSFSFKTVETGGHVSADFYRTWSSTSLETEAKSLRDSFHGIPEEPSKQKLTHWMREVFKGEEDADWNTMLQNARDEQKDLNIDRLKSLTTIIRAFVQTAESYAKVIISERNVPVEKKHIKPIGLGGVAGGMKFQCNGILFKFAVDTEISPGLWMYGGAVRRDEYAIKAAHKELQGLEVMMTSRTNLMHFPLMALIDYKGYRISAISLLPINKDTLVYGSSDGGRSIHYDEPEVNAEMQSIMEALNIRSHNIHGHQIYGPGDMEVHRGTDGRLYAVDLARLLPPENPTVDPQTHEVKEPRSVYYKLLRPELVGQSPVPLCSDTFTGWDKMDPNSEQHQSDIRKLTDSLKTQIIPIAAQNYAGAHHHSKHLESLKDFASVLEAHKHFDLVTFVHHSGINLRHIGLFRHSLPNSTPRLKQFVLEFAAARTLKNIIRNSMRDLMDIIRIPADEPFFELFVGYLNRFMSIDSDLNWRSFFRMELDRFYPGILEQNEKDVSILGLVDMRVVIVYLCDMFGVTIKNVAWKHFFKSLSAKESFTFLETDIDSIVAKTHNPYMHYLYDVMYRFLKCRDLPRQQSHRLLKDAQKTLRNSIRRMSRCAMSNFFLANIMADLANTTQNPKKAQHYFEEADKYYQISSRLFVVWKECYVNRSAAKFDYAVFLKKQGEKKKAKQVWEEAEKIFDASNSIETKCARFEIMASVFSKDVANRNQESTCQYKKQCAVAEKTWKECKRAFKTAVV